VLCCAHAHQNLGRSQFVLFSETNVDPAVQVVAAVRTVNSDNHAFPANRLAFKTIFKVLLPSPFTKPDGAVV